MTVVRMFAGKRSRDHPVVAARKGADHLPAGRASDAALAVELRDELRRRAADYRSPRPRRGRRNPNAIPRKRYTPEEIATALRLLRPPASLRVLLVAEIWNQRVRCICLGFGHTARGRGAAPYTRSRPGIGPVGR